MVLHRPLQIFLRRASGKLERRIQGVQFEEIAMRAGRRTGSSIADASKSDMPCLALFGSASRFDTFSSRPRAATGIFQATQCTHVPAGASGSSAIKAKLFALPGMSDQLSGGDMSCRHMYISWESFHLPQMRRMRVSSANLLCPREIRIKSLLGRVSDPHCRASSSTSIAELGQQSKESWAVRRDALPQLSRRD